MRLIKSAHTVYQTQYHIVVVTRFRRKWIKKGIAIYLKLKIKEVLKYYLDWEIIEIGIDIDHFHLHMIIPPKYRVSDVVRTIKSNTSRTMKVKFPFLKKVYRRGTGIWSVGYFVSTVGADEDVIRRYVAEQGKEDKGQMKFEW